MDKEIKFVINKKIEIVEDDGIYKSNIQDVREEDVSISIPVKDNKYLTLRTGERIEGIYYEKENIYKFRTAVKGRKIDRVMMIVLEKPDKFIKIQRRSFVRVPIVLDVCCGVLDKHLNVKDFGNNQIEFWNAYSIDISAGGIKIITDEKLQRGDILMVALPIKNEMLTLKCKAVRIDKDLNTDKNLCGLKFLDLDNNTREKIVKMLFRVMREQMKKSPKGD